MGRKWDYVWNLEYVSSRQLEIEKAMDDAMESVIDKLRWKETECRLWGILFDDEGWSNYIAAYLEQIEREIEEGE